LFPAAYLEQERNALGDAFKREYLGIPDGGQASPFTWDLYDRAIRSNRPLVPAGPAFTPPSPLAPVPVPNPFHALSARRGLP
jgi:hypothetical protein